VAAAINFANVRNVSASAANTFDGTAGATGVLPAAAFSVNGIDVGPIGGLTAAARAASAAGAISATTATSGVSASASGGVLTLSSADGRDIILNQAVAGAVESLGLTLGTHTGTVTVTEAPRPGAHSLRIGGANPAAAGLSAGKLVSVIIGPPNLQPQTMYTRGEPAMDLSTFTGASEALDYLDAKIDEVSNIRAMLGATSNRLTAAADNAGNTADNLTASRSRILDADYASETAQLTRSQILQQAGMSMIAQANTLPGQALLLLR
jgi:flagellin